MKLRPGRLVVVLVFLVAVLAVAAGVRRHRNRPPQTTPNASKAVQQLPKTGELQFKGLELSDRDEAGNLRWRVAASGSMDFDRQTGRARARDVNWELTRADGATMTLQAPQFTADLNARKVELSKGVRAQSTAEGLVFSSSAVYYDMASEHLRAEGPVDAAFRDFTLRASALGVDRTSSNYTLMGPVQFTYADYRASAGKAIVNSSTRRAVLTGSPRIQRGAYIARAERIRADAVAEEVTLDGSVKLSRGPLSAISEHGWFGKAQQRAELSGGVELSGEGFTARGERLAVDGGTSTATLSGRARLHIAMRR